MSKRQSNLQKFFSVETLAASGEIEECVDVDAAICDNAEERGNIDERANREVAVHRNEEGAPAIRRGSSDIVTEGIIIDDSVDDSDAIKQLNYWHPSASRFFQDVKDKIDSSIYPTGQGRHRILKGTFPKEYTGTISPSSNVLGYFASELKSGTLKMSHFCLPDLFVWYPEAQFPFFYRSGVPPCKFHGCTNCVMRHAWMQQPRRAHASIRNVAILSKVYYCSDRKKKGIKPYFFSGFDKKVIEKSPDYVKMQWRKHGFDFSHKSGIANSVLRQLRASIVQGLSVSGFRQTLIQQLKEYHLMLSIQWRAYVDYISKHPPLIGRPTRDELDALHEDFVDFNSPEYDQDVPSNAWLIQRVVMLMESDAEYKRRRMELIDGRHLSADHSFKLTKCMMSGGSKPFTACYCLLNEFGQVSGFWFTTGTSMNELKNVLSKIKHRYQSYGYEGPNSVTIDNCCQERQFWNSTLGFDDMPPDTQFLTSNDLQEIEVVTAPSIGQVASTVGMCDMFVGWIDEKLAELPPEQQVIIVDGEWRVGHSRMDLLIICLPFSEYRVYIFQLTRMCNNHPEKLPRALKTLLEDSSVKKVGNRICSDVQKLKGWNVVLQPTVELGHLAYDRGLVHSRNAGLDIIIDSLFGDVELEGKHGDTSRSRTSNWAAAELTETQRNYATVDGYATGISYTRMMQIMVPKLQARLLVKDAIDGVSVTLHQSGWKGRVVEGIIRGLAPTRGMANIEIDLRNEKSIYAPATIVDVITENNEVSYHSIAALRSESTSDHAIIRWPLFFCRRTISMSGSSVPITINTSTKQVLVDSDISRELHVQRHDGRVDDSSGVDSNSSGSDSSEGENDIVARLPRSRRRQINYYRCEKCKNDIVHIFFRYQHVLKKQHGAYFSFMNALRDAIYVVNQDDLDECCQKLRDERQYSERKIYQKLKYDYDWFLKRVRRLVPAPHILEERYMEVYEQYKDICCSKTGEKLFATPASHNVHKATLKHIQRNCLSDIPLESYYSPIREDRLGLTVNHCFRGTPGNEGLHQKMRQLVRGFSNSPRFVFALLTDYFLIWNQSIDIRLRGLPSKYDGLYCGDLLEYEIDKMASWKNRETPPHPDWLSTRSVQSTGETFGFLVNNVQSRMTVDVEEDSLASGGSDAFDVAEELEGLDEGSNEFEASLATELPASAQHMAALFGRCRPPGKVMANVEWEYFKNNLPNFQGGGNTEADNYCSIRFSDFATSWNEWVDSLGSTHPDVTYKTAAYLRDAYKCMKRRTVESSTLRPHSQSLGALKQKHTNESANRAFDDEFLPALEVAPIRPSRQVNAPTETTAMAEDDGFLADDEFEQTNTTKRGKPLRKGSMHRCRMCGKQYALPEWLPFHDGPHNEVWKNCIVDPQLYDEGFPVLTGRFADDEFELNNTTKRRKPLRKGTMHRCRMCGQQYALPEWLPFHSNNKPSIEEWSGQKDAPRHLRNGPNNKVWKNCEVDPQLYDEGFPVLTGRMPPPKKRKN